MIVGAQVPEINTESVVHVYRHEGKYLNAHRPTIRACAPCVCHALIPAESSANPSGPALWP